MFFVEPTSDRVSLEEAKSKRMHEIMIKKRCVDEECMDKGKID